MLHVLKLVSEFIQPLILWALIFFCMKQAAQHPELLANCCLPMWTFLFKMFHKTSVSLRLSEQLEHFERVSLKPILFKHSLEYDSRLLFIKILIFLFGLKTTQRILEKVTWAPSGIYHGFTTSSIITPQNIIPPQWHLNLWRQFPSVATPAFVPSVWPIQSHLSSYSLVKWAIGRKKVKIKINLHVFYCPFHLTSGCGTINHFLMKKRTVFIDKEPVLL